MLQRVKKFGKLSFKEQLLFSEACFLQLVTGLLLKIIPFRWILRVYASRQSAVGSRQSSVDSPQSTVGPDPDPSGSRIHVLPGAKRDSPQSADLHMIKTAIAQAGMVARWKNRCLISSLAGRCMLRRRKIPSQLSLGVIKDGNCRMIAHAWLKAGDFEIIEKNGDYTELFLF